MNATLIRFRAGIIANPVSNKINDEVASEFSFARLNSPAILLGGSGRSIRVLRFTLQSSGANRFQVELDFCRLPEKGEREIYPGKISLGRRGEGGRARPYRNSVGQKSDSGVVIFTSTFRSAARKVTRCASSTLLQTHPVLTLNYVT